ncbi:hypothetical protein [Candidatus Absconditicoccus praedator]|uniref:hypothetical protein n=1 Tax=Candidatus Absconditicoccus praedator TaxID=2735562 RepID=UPI001E3D488B|nr:hypothetical protein [Candidatus Absconditicoccus praedator]UFX82589.1 hypothetical protein HLG78_00350 [Candidatus Absconditicoccus praedator]
MSKMQTANEQNCYVHIRHVYAFDMHDMTLGQYCRFLQERKNRKPGFDYLKNSGMPVFQPELGKLLVGNERTAKIIKGITGQKPALVQVFQPYGLKTHQASALYTWRLSFLIEFLNILDKLDDI